MSDPAVAPVEPTVAALQTQMAALQAELAAKGVIGGIESDVSNAASALVAKLRTTLDDLEGTITHVHGAAKALQADVKANWPLLLIGLAVTAELVLRVLSIFKVL